jgi:hypothetical protein
MRTIKGIRDSRVIIALGLFCLILSCCLTGRCFAQSADSVSSVTMRIVGEYFDRASVIATAPPALRDTLAKFFPQVPAEVRPDSGSHYIWSSNGEYLLVRRPIPDSKEYWDRIPATLYDPSGHVIWKGTTLCTMAVSNNGRNMLGWGEDGGGPAIYDISNPEPLKYYYELMDAQFSYDGNFIVGTEGRAVSLFTARGERIWSRLLYIGGGDVVMSSRGSHVLAGGRAVSAGRNRVSEFPGEFYFTVLGKDGSVLGESMIPDRYIRYEVFSPDDGQYAAIAGDGSFVFVRTDPFGVLWRYEPERGIVSSSPGGISEGGQWIVFGTAEIRGGNPESYRYRLFDRGGNNLANLEVDFADHQVFFVGNERYVVSWNPILSRLRLIEIVR